MSISVDLGAYKRIFGFDFIEEYADHLEALTEKGWIEIAAEKLTLVGDGVFYTPLIQRLLAHERMEEMRKGRAAGPVVTDVASKPPRSSATQKFPAAGLSLKASIAASDMVTTVKPMNPESGRAMPRKRAPDKYGWHRERTEDGVELSLIRISQVVRSAGKPR